MWWIVLFEWEELLLAGHQAQQNLNIPRLLATLFSPTVFRGLGDDWSPRLRERLQFLEEFAPGQVLASAFDLAFEEISNSYPNEYVFKNRLVETLVFHRHGHEPTSALHELRVGRSLVDLGVFNGTSTAYEIKTDLDTLRRLPTQIGDYRAAFEHVNVVTSGRMGERTLAALPDEVGLIELTPSGLLRELRPAKSNLGILETGAIFRLLNRQEVLRILKRVLDYSEDSTRATIWARTKVLFCSLPIEVAHREAVCELRLRDSARREAAQAVPTSLRSLALSVRMSKKSRGVLLGRLDSHLADL